MEAVLRGPFGQTTLGSNVITIGRTPDNQVVVNDPQASSRHAEIRPAGQDNVITDVGSANGTYINGQRLDWNVPRLLRNGDTIRIGDTTFTYEVRGTPQYNQAQGSSPGYEPTIAASPSTSYGQQQGYPPQPSPPYSPYNPPQQPSYTPPPPSSYPPMPQYDSPSYAPPPPSYGAAPQQGYTPPGGIPYAPPAAPPQPRRRSNVGLIVIIVLVLVVILGSIGIFFVVRNNQIATDNANATATANANTTATARANVTATAHAQAAATATFVADPYGTGTLAFFDPMKDNSKGHQWSEQSFGNGAAHCGFSGGAYHASESRARTFDFCTAQATTFSNFAFQADMTVANGDCGGLVFRLDSANFKLYFFEVCSDGRYGIAIYDQTSGKYLKGLSTSSAIKTGANQMNVIAAVANGSTIQGYVNGTMVDTATDSTFSQGQLALLVDNFTGPTDVAYSNVKVWTT